MDDSLEPGLDIREVSHVKSHGSSANHMAYSQRCARGPGLHPIAVRIADRCRYSVDDGELKLCSPVEG